MKVKKSTIVRTILLIVAVINRLLTSKGIGINIFMNEDLANVLADLFLSIMSVIAFWYNNSFTKDAIAADNYLSDLRGGVEDEGDVGDAAEDDEEN